MLDKNLFTLHLTPSICDSSSLDLKTPTGEAYYTRHRHPSPEYTISLHDAHTRTLFSTATSPCPSSKSKTIQLYNPRDVVELRYTGHVSFKWRFEWKGFEFEWRREECFLILGKPEAPVLVAVAEEPLGKVKTSLVQFLDYNLNRFDIEDRQGLEVVLLTALLTFQDYNEQPSPPNSSSDSLHVPCSSGPPRPQRETSATSVDLVASLHAAQRLSSSSPSYSSSASSCSSSPSSYSFASSISSQSSYSSASHRSSYPSSKFNSIRSNSTGSTTSSSSTSIPSDCLPDHVMYVESPGPTEAWGAFIATQLLSNNKPFVVLKSVSQDLVPKTLGVVEEVKRIRHNRGEEGELWLHVAYSHAQPDEKGEEGKKSKRNKLKKAIRLDGEERRARECATAPALPESVTIHLSKIPLPHLAPHSVISSSNGTIIPASHVTPPSDTTTDSALPACPTGLPPVPAGAPSMPGSWDE